jgi:hypothetical protein
LRHAIARCKKKEIGAMTALRIAAPKIGSANGPESLTDPGPTLRRAIFAAERLVRPEGASRRPGYIFRR